MESKQSLSTQTDISEIVKTYTKHWKWFIIFALLGLIVAFLYIRYATPEYEANAKIHILEDKNASSELSAFNDLDILGAGTNKVEDEIEILNSRGNFIEVVQDLKLNITHTVLGNVKSTEIYHNRPFNINFIENDSIINNSEFTFFVDIQSDNTFGYGLEEDSPRKIYAYGKNIKTEIGDIVLTPNLSLLEKYIDRKIRIDIRPIFTVAETYQKKVIVVSAEEGSNIIDISLTDPIKEKAINILDKLIYVYNQNAIEDKKIIADRTSNFIDDRIEEISLELNTVDQSAEDFKTQKGVTDIASESNIALNVSASNRAELENARTQLNIAAGMNQYLAEEDSYEVLPSNVGLNDGSIANTTARYNELVLERKRLLKSADEQNPVIVNLDQQLNSLKEGISSSLSGMERNLGMQVNNLSSQLSRINTKIYSAPSNSRQLRDIERQQQTTESLFLYLLQKREESQITLASSSPKSKVIDKAHLAKRAPVKPKKQIIFLASVILGLLIPFSAIYAGQMFDNKINSRTQLEGLVNNLSVIGEVPSIGKKESLLVQKDDRSALSESMRILRTNLDYILKSKKSGNGNIVYVTSTVPGEGKTFVSSNLAMILASTDKKILLIGADIRNPKLHTFFGGKNVDKLNISESKGDLGFTEYLFNKSLSAKDVINPMLVHTNTIDIIYSGKVPPNPSELLMNGRVKTLFEEISSLYDYIIVDTAPLMVVTDTLLLTEYADHVLYVVRAGNTETKVIDFPVKLHEEGKLPALSFVVNDVKHDNLGYGGKYGYGYGKNTKKWWKF
ncbi:GumC family protein [Maribacter sp. 2210JD10-5]|uniref:GumC family protein n=1 Tax=Maribacter sp. 2210JD10-5 TaxID=3386272 RepID=UPI0039BD7452